MIPNNIEQLKTKLLNDFSDTISEDYEDKEILVKSFEEYVEFLIESYKRNSSLPFNKSSIDDDIIQKANSIINSDLELKKQKLISDIDLKKIEIISKSIFEDALKLTNGQKVKKDYLKKIEEMKKILPTVKSENKKIAEKLISEAVLDSTYIRNPNIQCYSFRLAKEISNKEER